MRLIKCNIDSFTFTVHSELFSIVQLNKWIKQFQLFIDDDHFCYSIVVVSREDICWFWKCYSWNYVVYFCFVPKAHATILHVNLSFNTWYWAWHFTFWPEHMILSLTLNTAPGPELMTLSLTLTWWTLSMCGCHSRRPPPGASWPRLSPPTCPHWSWPPGAPLSRPARG